MEFPGKALRRELQSEAENAFRPFHTELDIDMNYYYSASTFWEQKLDYYLSRKGFPKGFKFKTPAFAKFAVELAVGNIMTGEVPTVNVAYAPDPNGKPISTARENARQRVEHALQGILTAVATTKRENPLRDMAIKTVGYGMGAIASPVDRALYLEHPLGLTKKGKPKEPKNPKERLQLARWQRNRSTQIPWNISSVHTKNILIDPWNDPPQWAIEKRRVSARAVSAEYGIELTSKSGDGDLVTFCSEEWYSVDFNGTSVLSEKRDKAQDGTAENADGMWYDFALSGMGDVNDKGELQYLYQGIIRPNRPTFDILLTGLNVEEAIRLVTAFPVLAFRKDKNAPPNAKDETKDFELAAAAIWVHQWYEQHKLELPDVPPVVVNLMEEGRRLLEIGVGPGILRGEWRQETASGMLTRLEQARLPFLPAKASLEQATANMLQKMCWQTKHRLREPISKWVKIKGEMTQVILDPDDIEDGMMISVDFTPPTETEKAAKLQVLIERHAAGAISRRRLIAMDDSPITDVDAEMADIYSEQMMDLALQQMAQEALQPAPEPVAPGAAVEEVPVAGAGGFQQEGAAAPVQPVAAPAEAAPPQFASLAG